MLSIGCFKCENNHHGAITKIKILCEDYETLFEKKYIRVFGISGKSQQEIDSSRLSIRINNRLDFVSCREVTFKLLYGENEFLKYYTSSRLIH